MEEYWIHGKIFIVYLRFYFKKSLKLQLKYEILDAIVLDQCDFKNLRINLSTLILCKYYKIVM